MVRPREWLRLRVPCVARGIWTRDPMRLSLWLPRRSSMAHAPFQISNTGRNWEVKMWPLNLLRKLAGIILPSPRGFINTLDLNFRCTSEGSGFVALHVNSSFVDESTLEEEARSQYYTFTIYLFRFDYSKLIWRFWCHSSCSTCFIQITCLWMVTL